MATPARAIAVFWIMMKAAQFVHIEADLQVLSVPEDEKELRKLQLFAGLLNHAGLEETDFAIRIAEEGTIDQQMQWLLDQVHRALVDAGFEKRATSTSEGYREYIRKVDGNKPEQ